MQNYNNAVDKLFEEKESLIILGLTGRTGAGCSTAASILSKDFNELDLKYIEQEGSNIDESFKFDIIKNYIAFNERWVPFTIIEGSCIILSMVFEQKEKSDSLIKYLSDLQEVKEINFKIENFDELVKELHGLDYIFDNVQSKSLKVIDNNFEKIFDEINNKIKTISDDKIDEYYKLYIETLPKYKERIQKILLKYSCFEERKNKIQDEPKVKYHLYTYILQKIGNNIRSSGNPYNNRFCQEKIFSFAERIEKIVNLIIRHDKIVKKSKTRICIDAIRNVNESNYLKDKYRPYFLLSINVDENTRRKRLGKLNIEEQNSLDNVEYNSKLESEEFFYHQNIANCFEMADIHLVNKNEKNNKYFSLTWQLVKYITLMLHPGLITPNAIEQCMQLAYNAKYSSGCLSRQVGAVVTDANYIVKSVGWNEVPEGQLSCVLRNISDYCVGNKEECFSKFEHEDVTFRRVLDGINQTLKRVDLHGRKYSYCFKDVYNGYKKERNQVFTRSLHAEENAFLQISKHGGQGIKGGYLFCTASPCELCAKKSYHLGIENIYYIDPYPGISQEHILSFGKSKKNPNINLFYGAIGEAYIRLYKPQLPFKDELELVSGINCKKEAVNIIDSYIKEPKTTDFLYELVEFSLEFIDRKNIEATKNVDIIVQNGEYNELNRHITWTGSSYERAELIGNNEGYTLIDSQDKVSPYNYKIKFNKKIKPNDRIKYGIKYYVKDETELMHEYLSQMIKHPTNHLKLQIIIPKDNMIVENIKYVRYADLKMEIEYPDDRYEIKETCIDDKRIYCLEIDNPNLFYTYSLEWDFIKIK